MGLLYGKSRHDENINFIYRENRVKGGAVSVDLRVNRISAPLCQKWQDSAKPRRENSLNHGILSINQTTKEP